MMKSVILILSILICFNGIAQFSYFDLYLCKNNGKTLYLPAKKGHGTGVGGDSLLSSSFTRSAEHLADNSWTLLKIENGIVLDLFAGIESFHSISDFHISTSGIQLIACRETKNASGILVHSFYYISSDLTGHITEQKELSNVLYPRFDSLGYMGVVQADRSYYLHYNETALASCKGCVLYPFTSSGLALARDTTTRKYFLVNNVGQTASNKPYDDVWFFSSAIAVARENGKYKILGPGTNDSFDCDTAEYISARESFLHAYAGSKHYIIRIDGKPILLNGITGHSLADVSFIDEHHFLLRKTDQSGQDLWSSFTLYADTVSIVQDSISLKTSGGIVSLAKGYLLLQPASSTEPTLLGNSISQVAGFIKLPALQNLSKVFRIGKRNEDSLFAYFFLTGQDKAKPEDLDIVLIRIPTAGTPDVWTVATSFFKYRYDEFTTDVIELKNNSTQAWCAIDLMDVCTNRWAKNEAFNLPDASHTFGKINGFTRIAGCGIKCTYASKNKGPDIIINAAGDPQEILEVLKACSKP